MRLRESAAPSIFSPQSLHHQLEIRRAVSHSWFLADAQQQWLPRRKVAS
jgi:hypothetical protein